VLTQRLGEQICELEFSVDLLNHNTSILKGVTKVMPFNPKVFGPRMELVRIVDEFKATCVIFIDCFDLYMQVLIQDLVLRMEELGTPKSKPF
jgi:hypothetical protein